LLEHGADPNHTDPWGQTAVHHAAGKSNLDVLQAVLDAGGDPTPQGLYGWTPLQNAERVGKHKEESPHCKAIKAAIVDWEAKQQAKYQTLGLLVVLAIAMEAGGNNLSGGYRWLACSPSSVFAPAYWTEATYSEGRGAGMLSDEALDGIYDEECSLSLLMGKMIALCCIAWMLCLFAFWVRFKDKLKWRSI